jgi:hypothetical protein
VTKLDLAIVRGLSRSPGGRVPCLRSRADHPQDDLHQQRGSRRCRPWRKIVKTRINFRVPNDGVFEPV